MKVGLMISLKIHNDLSMNFQKDPESNKISYYRFFNESRPTFLQFNENYVRLISTSTVVLPIETLRISVFVPNIIREINVENWKERKEKSVVAKMMSDFLLFLVNVWGNLY